MRHGLDLYVGIFITIAALAALIVCAVLFHLMFTNITGWWTFIESSIIKNPIIFIGIVIISFTFNIIMILVGFLFIWTRDPKS